MLPGHSSVTSWEGFSNMADQPRSQVLVTDKIRRSIRTVLTKESVPNDLRGQLRKYASSRRSSDNKGQRMIPFELVQVVFDYLKTRQGNSNLSWELQWAWGIFQRLREFPFCCCAWLKEVVMSPTTNAQNRVWLMSNEAITVLVQKYQRR